MLQAAAEVAACGDACHVEAAAGTREASRVCAAGEAAGRAGGCAHAGPPHRSARTSGHPSTFSARTTFPETVELRGV